MPLGIMEVYQKEMNKIEASEQLSMINSLAVGGGNLKQEDSSRIINRLERAAMGDSPRTKAKPSPQALAAMGIKVEIVKKKEKTDG